jgi:hypothetical protein
LRGRCLGKSGSIRFHNASSSSSAIPDRLRVGQATVPRLRSKYKSALVILKRTLKACTTTEAR